MIVIVRAVHLAEVSASRDSYVVEDDAQELGIDASQLFPSPLDRSPGTEPGANDQDHWAGGPTGVIVAKPKTLNEADAVEESKA